MAYVHKFECTVCHQPRVEVVVHTGFPVVCAACRTGQTDQERRMHFAGLSGLTLEERLHRIEEQLYDLHAERRLKALEAKTVTY